MKKLLTSPLLFLIIIAGDLTGRVIDSQLLDYIFKPLLMIWLLGYFIQQVREVKEQKVFTRYIILAIVFSWLGDVSLMFADKGAMFFVLGLSNFLLAHVFYIVAYYKAVGYSDSMGFVKKQPIWIIPFLLIGVGLYSYLFPHLKAMAVPVLVYATTIVLMAIFALHRKGTTSLSSFQNIFVGALIFMLSDSCIAINKFVNPIPQAGLIIMITYISAQYLIVQGAIGQIKGA